MRVANVRGAKRVTLVGASGAPPSGVSAEAGGGASESLKFRLIEPHGTVQSVLDTRGRVAAAFLSRAASEPG